MKALLALVALSALGSFGCNNLPKPGMSYTLQLDPTMSAEASEAAITASYAWSTAIPGLTFTYLMQSCQALEHSICISSDQTTPLDGSGNKIEGHTDHLLLTDSAAIVLHPANISAWCHNELLDTTTHELGHAISFRGDHLTAGNLMDGAVSCSAVVESITISDVQYFWSNR